MRIDKYLKVSRIIKRRTVAKLVCSAGKVLLNSSVARPSDKVNIGDIIEVDLPAGFFRLEVLSLDECIKKEDASSMYRRIELDVPN